MDAALDEFHAPYTSQPMSQNFILKAVKKRMLKEIEIKNLLV
jgi:hypothetical protein